MHWPQQFTTTPSPLGRSCSCCRTVLAAPPNTAKPLPRLPWTACAAGKRANAAACGTLALAWPGRLVGEVLLWPAQVGVAVPEKAVHATRAWVDSHNWATDKVLVKLDFANAFNCIDRGAVLQRAPDGVSRCLKFPEHSAPGPSDLRVQHLDACLPGLSAGLLELLAALEHFPSLAHCDTWCYGQPSRLQFGEHVLSSSCSVQHGDPLGPLLFAAAIQPLALELRTAPTDLSTFFLDDGVLGSVAVVGAALAHTQ